MSNFEKIISSIDLSMSTSKDARMKKGQIYRNTNENLTAILGSYDLKDKNVLSVLASSDQVFSSYYYGAKTVDSFDRQIIAYYYYYLKYWNLLETGRHYIPAKNSEIRKIIELHKNERIQVYKFWDYILKRIGDVPLYYSNLFVYSPYPYSVPYENDTNKLIEILKDKQPSFKNINLFERNTSNKKYDVIVLSNILEYMFTTEDEEIKSIVLNNIYNLLEDDGIIISSNLFNNSDTEDELLLSLFEYEEGIKGYNYMISNDEIPLCYSLKKRGGNINA